MKRVSLGEHRGILMTGVLLVYEGLNPTLHINLVIEQQELVVYCSDVDHQACRATAVKVVDLFLDGNKAEFKRLYYLTGFHEHTSKTYIGFKEPEENK